MKLKSLTFALCSIACATTALANPSTPISKPAAKAQSVLSYWTPEHMQNATPMDLPMAKNVTKMAVDKLMAKYKDEQATIVQGAAPTVNVTLNTHQLFQPNTNQGNVHPQDVGTLNEEFSSQPLVPVSADQSYPYTTVGKLFFTTPSGDKTCSGFVIANRVVVTAAHCLYSAQSGWYSNWMFIPAYRNGTAPFEIWTAQSVSFPAGWSSTGGVIPNEWDYGMIVVNDRTIGSSVKNLASVVGKLGYQTLSTMPNHAHLLGYPGNLDKGEQMHQVTSQSAVAVAPDNAEYGSDMSTGAGGGPWVQNFGPASAGTVGGKNPARNMVIGVTSYGYNDTTSFGNGSPILDSNFTNLYTYMCGLAAGNC